MIFIYSACVAVSVVMCFWYFLVDVRQSIVENIMLLSLAVACIGYLSLAVQTDLSGAILSCKIYYLGACFLPMLFFLSVCEVCNVSLKTSVVALSAALQIFIFICVCSIGYSTVFYTDASITIINGICTLSRNYGPLHFLYPLTLYAYLTGSLCVSIYACIAKKTVLRRGLVAMIVCEALATSYYLIDKLLIQAYDFTPVVYIVLMAGSLIPIYQADVFDVEENEEVINKQLGKAGFITFDKKMNYMGANDFVLNLFGDLRGVHLSKRLTNPAYELIPLLADVQGFLTECRDDGYQHRSGVNLKIGERTFETELHTLLRFKRYVAGVTVELRDVTDHIRVLELTEHYNEQLNREVEQKTEQIRSIQEKMIIGMAQMVESRDLSTGGHIRRTSDVVRIFSNALTEAGFGFDPEFLHLVIRSAPMHDLGKIGVDDAILRKQSEFTDDEYEIMKTHAAIGSEIVDKVMTDVEDQDFVQVAENVAHYHHEKVDGRGYPCGLKGDEIPIEARIMALADVFDALVSKRCYKEAFSYDKAFSIIQEESGTHFDPELVKVFMSCRAELEAYYDSVEH